MELKGKKMLVLGCTNNAQDVHKFAVENGVKIIVAGLSFSIPIQKIADELCVIDILDKDALIKLIKEKNIDGIFVGGNEDIISCAIDVAEATSLPFYATRQLWDLTSNKAVFKKACREYGIPTTKEYIINDDTYEEDIKNIQFPIVIKPVDACGSRGVNMCRNEQDLRRCIKEAKENSKSGKIIAEELVEGQELVIYYTFCDGKVSLTSMSDKMLRLEDSGFNPLSEVYAYPSVHLQEYLEKIDEKMRKMLLWFGIRNGITSMQGFYTKDGEFKFFEMGYRLGGTAQYHYTEHINGINSFDMMMRFALTGKMDEANIQERDNASFSKKCCTLSLLSKGGTVAKISGVEEARSKKGVLCLENRYNVGDYIKPTRTVSQFHIRLFLVTDTTEEMKELIEDLQSSIKVYDDKGEQMLITKFDTERLLF